MIVTCSSTCEIHHTYQLFLLLLHLEPFPGYAEGVISLLESKR